MKRIICAMMVAILSLTAVACGTPKPEMGGVTEPLYRDAKHKSRFGMVRNDMINGNERLHTGGQNEIGYFKYNPVNYHHTNGQGQAPGPDVFIDRALLARHVAQLVTVLPNVKDATALVTDDHIFLGVTPKNGHLDGTTTKEAKRTAESVTPRYYKVHVMSSHTLEKEVGSVGMRMRGSNDVEGIKGDLEKLLRKLGDTSPPDVNESIRPTNPLQINPLQK